MKLRVVFTDQFLDERTKPWCFTILGRKATNTLLDLLNSTCKSLVAAAGVCLDVVIKDAACIGVTVA